MEANLCSSEIGASPFQELLSPVGFGLYKLVFFEAFLL